ncbi:MAG: hypothetical protein MZV64_12690 [Ignavibacteriales bacterium]|nr:hypothetical protein [Ignavibacteriales bacterium]
MRRVIFRSAVRKIAGLEDGIDAAEVPLAAIVAERLDGLEGVGKSRRPGDAAASTTASRMSACSRSAYAASGAPSPGSGWVAGPQ